MKKLVLLIEITSFPLIFLSFLYLITCYQMLFPELAFMAARKVHTDKVLRILLITFGVLHTYLGLLMICERRVENLVIKRFFRILITIFLIITFSAFIVFELTV